MIKPTTTFRTTAPKATWERLSCSLKHIGITRVANITGLDTLNIPVACAIRPNAKYISVSQGKGLTLLQAKISAVMESVESYHFENPAPATHHDSYQALQQQIAIVNPDTLKPGLFQAHNALTQPQHWQTALELNSNQPILVPYAITNLDSTALQPEQAFYQVSTSGLAAGNTKNEAMCHAIGEKLERHFLAHWSEASPAERDQQCIDPNSIDEINQALLQVLKNKGFSLNIWAINQTVDTPAFLCALSDDNSLRHLGICYGSAAHWHAATALRKAILEAIQTRLTIIMGAREDIEPSFYKKNKQVHAPLAATKPSLSFSSLTSNNFDPDSAKDFLLAQLQHLGCQQIIILDHTKDDIGLPVVQILLPNFKGHI